jgi:hypothetical protein
MLASHPIPRISSTMKLDPAVVKLLDLDPEHTHVSSAGGGGCSSASTSKITAKLEDGQEKLFFMKTGHGSDAKVMFEGLMRHCSIHNERGVLTLDQGNMLRSEPFTTPFLPSALSPWAMADSRPRHRPTSSSPIF